MVSRARPLSAGDEPAAAAAGFRSVRVVLRAVLRTVGALRPAAAALRPQVRPSLVARVAVRHRGGGSAPRTQQTGRRPAHLTRCRRLPVRLGRDTVCGAWPPQHRADGAGSCPAGHRHRRLCGVLAARRERRHSLHGRTGGIRYQKDRHREKHADLSRHRATDPGLNSQGRKLTGSWEPVEQLLVPVRIEVSDLFRFFCRMKGINCYWITIEWVT